MALDNNGGGAACTSHSNPNNFNGGVDWDIPKNMALCCDTTALNVVLSVVCLPLHDI